MLSVENPPSDSHLKTDDDDENIKTSCSNIGAVDLLNSDFDVGHTNFSIRDYVYSARSKDIATNWPFSEKNLQQCRKLDQANESNPEGKTTSQFGQDELVSVNGATCNQKLNSDHLHITTSVSDQGEKEVPSEVEKSNSVKDSEAAILLEPSTKQVEAEILPVACKTDKISKPEPLVKKSRLMVKLGTLAGPSTKEDNMTNNFIVSEIMASKVCPVCKTFSSSSNTTLNAHIDQCLSGESTVKWKEEPKVIKHKIKPRKMRLMRDIYATALHCTLEDLDRRNGTNWASNSTPPDQSNELCVESRLESLPSAGIEETGHKEGEVYIDTDGTKVRILSKFNKVANIQGNSRAQNILRSNKFITDKKKKKHQKILKLVTDGKPCSSKPHPSFETYRNLTVGPSVDEEVELGQCSKAQEKIKLDDSGIIRRWVGSKRTGLTKKTPLEDKHQNPGQSLAKSYAESNCLLNKQHSFKNLVSSQTINKMETSNTEAGFRLYREQPPLGKKREFPWSCEGGVGYRKRSVILPKHKKLRKEGISVHDNCNKSPNHTSTRATSFSNKAAPTKTSDAFVVTSKTSRTHQEFSSEAMIASSTRTKLTNQVVVPKLRSHIKRKGSVSTKSHFNSQLEINNNFSWRPSQDDDDQQLDSMEDFTNERSRMEENMGKMGQNKVLRDMGAINFSRKEEYADGLKNSTNQPCNYGHGVGVMKEFSPVNIRSALEDSEDSFDDEESESKEGLAFREDVAIEQASTVANGGFISCSDSLVSEFPKLPSSPEKSKSEQYAEVDQWESCGHPTSSRGPSLSDEQVFSADAVGNVMTGEFNYFSEVDPIPIPGPPGSFLPSLGHMGSDDLQGNLLNTSQVQSTEDKHDFVDMDRSDSPVSAVSDISNPTLAMSKSRSFKDFAVDPLSAQDEIQRGFSGAAQVSQAANLGPEHFNVDKSRINAMSFPEKAPESQLQRQQTMRSDSFPKMQIDSDCSERLGNFNSRSGSFYFRNHPNSGHGKVVYPTRKFASEHIEKNVLGEHEVKFTALRDIDSASPSAPNPVLRLMGKNLMVVNKDEVPLLQHRQHQSSSMDSQPHLQCNSVSEVYPCGVTDYHSYHQVVAQSPIAFNQDQRQDAYGQKFDIKLSGNFEGNVDVETPQLPYHASRVKFPSMNVAGAFKYSLGQHDYKVGINMLAEERPRNRLNNPPTYGLQKNVATSGANLWDVGSTSSREIIMIDDPTNSETDFSTGTMCHDGMGKVRVFSSRNATNSISGDSKFSSRLTTSYNSNPSEGAGSFYGGQPVMHNASFQMPVSEGVNASPVMWSCNSEGLSFLRPNSLSSSSNSTSHLRPKIYYSPRLS
ncbi:hypothetical protein POM88_007693 [Heracleum sosnowskyi]|uniref:Uncharacterized protein n=1 Tax=Heracleum sosnowskyi TaxID=360622 RepID=A0AAD8N135_9APIA|nr:hypothetical protein POM88_007693 [Heracleum sosnowskyi]